MRKYFLALSAAVFLLIPISVYAYNSNITTVTTNETTTVETTTVEQSNNLNPNIENYDYMTGWMNNSFMSSMMNGNFIEICTDPGQHDQFIDELKLSILEQQQNEEITQEQAEQYLKDLDLMLKIHEEHHSEDNINSMNCH